MRALLILSIALSGCSWSTHERVAFGLAVAAQGADAATTIRGLDEGGTERNYILGGHPSNEAVILHKIAVLGIATIIGHFYADTRLPLFYGLAALGTGASLYNVRQF